MNYRNIEHLDTQNKLLFYMKNDISNAQDVLMKLSDREIAVSMLFMKKIDINFILSILPEAKSKRVYEELNFQKTLNMKKELYQNIINKVLSCFLSEKDNTKYRTYIKPRGRGE